MKKAFTLIELLVAITILSIIIIGAMNIDYNRLSNQQKLDIFTNNIKSNFERTRNNSLSGKGIGINLEIPKKWKIDYSNTSSGTIESSLSIDGTNWISNEKLLFQQGFYISQMKCLQLDGSLDNDIISSTGSIEFEGNNISLLGDCSANTSKILEISITNKSDTKILQLNTLNGLVEYK